MKEILGRDPNEIEKVSCFSAFLPAEKKKRKGCTMPATFRMSPQPIPDGHNFNGNYFHLTYKSFLALDRLLGMVGSATSVPFYYSWVQENGEPSDEHPEGYEHTHLALWFRARVNLRGSRTFDLFIPAIDDADSDGEEHPDGTVLHEDRWYHPNVQPKVKLCQVEQIWTRYHAGYKVDIKTGKPTFKAPVAHEYTLPPDFCFTRGIMDEMIEAPSLYEACVAGEIRPRTVTDVAKLRDSEAGKTKIFKHKFDSSTFKVLLPNTWTSLFIWGASNLGKTKWACAQFKNPLLVKPFDSIGCVEAMKKYDANVHDGIVFDEVNLNFLTREQALALVDFDDDFVLNVRYTAIEMDAGVRKLFISNFPKARVFPSDHTGAIDRRIKVYHVTEKTYYTAMPAPAAPTAPMFASPLTSGSAFAHVRPQAPASGTNLVAADLFASPS